MRINVKTSGFRIYFLTTAFVLFTCFYNFYSASFADHHCDNDHCSICAALHVIGTDVTKALADWDPNAILPDGGVFLITLAVFYTFVRLHKTPVTLRVKKTE